MSVFVPPSVMARLRVLIADDHMIVRDGLRLLIGTQADLEVIGEASDGLMTLELARSLRPNVILMDLRMPVLNGAQVIEALTLELPGIMVLVMSSSQDSSDFTAALRAGARGYLTKDAHHLEVLSAIRTVGQGGMVFGSALTAGLMDSLQLNPSFPETAVSARGAFAELTDREFEVLEVLAGDCRNRQIATRLGISEKTVRNHVSNIVWKLGAKDRDEVVAKALLAGLTGLEAFSPQAGVVSQVTPQAIVPGSCSVPGRERQWVQLENAWNAGLFIYITGPEGVGKTHLMNKFAASRGGEFIEFAGLPSDMGIPFGSFARSIRKMMAYFPDVALEPWITDELQRIVPTIKSQRPRTDLTLGEESKVRLFDAIAACHVTFAPHMAGLLVDDIQFFDPLSAEASMYTLSSWEHFSGKAGEAQHMIACYRSGVFPPQIEQGIRQQARAGIVALIELGPIEPGPVELGPEKLEMPLPLLAESCNRDP